MIIDLDSEEKVTLMIEGVCEFRVWGERNEEGTMIINSNNNQQPEVLTCQGEIGRAHV